MIKGLILKDLLLQKKTALFGLAYSVFLMAVFKDTTFSSSVYILCTVAISYILIMGAVAYDEKSKSDIVLNSLPLKRKTIVQAKYWSILVFGAGSIIFVGLIGALLKAVGLPFPARLMNFTDVAGAAFGLGLVSSFYLPFYYRFGYITSRLFNIVFFLLAFFSPSFLIGYLQERYDQQTLEQILTMLSGLPAWQFLSLLTAAVIILVFISYQISLHFYQRREF